MPDYKVISAVVALAMLCGFLFYYNGRYSLNLSFDQQNNLYGKSVRPVFKPNVSGSSNIVLVGIESPTSPVQLESLNIDTLKYMFHGLVTSNDHKCKQLKQFGRDWIGGYFVCMTGSIQPKPKSCLVYSFGVSTDWSFDEQMSSFGCEVHSFDPSIGLQDHIHPPGVNFHNAGLWESDFVNEKGWKLRSLSSLKKQLGHTKQPIDVLKVDAEGAEWPVFRELATFDLKVKQLIVEIHTPTVNFKPMTKTDYIEIIQSVLSLKKKGFLLYYNHHKYGCCSGFSSLMPPEIPEMCCYEMAFVNSQFM